MPLDIIQVSKKETYSLCTLQSTYTPPATHTITYQKKQAPSSSTSFSIRNRLILAGTFLLMLGAVLLLFKLQPHFEQVHLNRMSTTWGATLVMISIALLLIRIGFLLYMLLLSLRYRSIASVSDEQLPTCTVVVPAYNEGELVWQTLMSLANSNYPAEKIQLIAIDDGSQDDTWAWMQKARQVLGDRLAIYQQPENKGKRHALYRGFRLAKGDILITVDSDSIVDEDTLRNMASPFVVNEQCGAVAGNVRVLNGKKAMIPKMLNVSFAFSFEFVRSAQSVLGSVFCTPGALAAYRKDAVLACLSQWLHQTFMGKPSTIGEDRAMTNMILKQGYKVLFQRNAHVYTNIPETYNKLYKMFVRWERSNVRESIVISKFAFSNFRQGPKAGTRFLLLNQWLKLILSYPMTLMMLLFACIQPLLFLCSAILGIFAFSSIQAIFYSRRYKLSESFWAYSYGIFRTFTLFWITPYAIATAGRTGWLTRSLALKKG